MINVSNLYRNLGSYFALSFIMTEVNNLDSKLGITLSILYNGRGGSFIKHNKFNGYY